MKSTLPKILLPLVILLFLPFEKALNVGTQVLSPKYLADGVDCLIMIDNNIFSSHSRDIGFNYDLMDIFGKMTECNITRDSEPPSTAMWHMLADGKYDLMAFKTSDTIPQGLSDSIFVSIPVRDDCFWAVSASNMPLMNYINIFINEIKRNGTYRDLVYRHFRSYRIEPYLLDSTMKVNALSPYDDIVRKYGRFTGVDWRLLSAIIYQESRYNMATTSSHNAKGLMQVLESTAAHYGVDDVYDPDLNVKAGTLYFSGLLDRYREEGMDELNAVKFALGSYNAGEARIAECRNMADSLGLDRNVWEDVVEAFGSMENFSGREQTTQYVINVLGRYADYQKIIE